MGLFRPLAIGAMTLLLSTALAAEADAPDVALLLDDGSARELTLAELAERPGRFAFAPGERLVYEIGYWGMPIATASLEVLRFIEVEGRRFAHLVGRGDTNEVFSTFYPIHDRTEAWIDIDSLRTHRTATHTRHGREKESLERVHFDWDTHFVHVAEDKRHSRRRREVGLDLGPIAHDSFDAFYAIRSLPLEVGTTARLPVYANRKIYALEVAVDRRERIRFQGERVDTRVVRPKSLLDGEALGNGRGELHVNAAGIPLRLDGWFETPSGFRIGGVKAELIEWHPGANDFAPAETGSPPHVHGMEAVETRNGIPIWDVPAEVEAARRAGGVTAYSRKIPLDRFDAPAR